MKKKLSLALAVAMAASVGTTAVVAAAANPFSDVPAKHWSYGAIQQLAKDGIVDGFNDGTFKGDKTMTRYEMATVVARAMAKEDKANADQKAIIDKLAAEYSTELQNLGVRVTNLENKVGNITWTGYARLRYEGTGSGSTGTNQSDSAGRTRVRLNFAAPLDDTWSFKGRIQYDSSDSTSTAVGNSTNSVSGTNFAMAWMEGKALGLDQVKIGRAPVWLGQGFIADAHGSSGTGVAPDGITIGKNIGAANLQYGIARFNNVSDTNYNVNPNLAIAKTLNMQFASLTTPVFDGLNFDASYLKDNNGGWAYKTWAVGLNYSGISNINIMGEYGQNKSKLAQITGVQDKAKAYKAQIKWQGADKKTPNTWGLWYAYRKWDTNFDPADLTTEDMTTYQVAALTTTGLKGNEYGIEYVPFKNSVLTFRYEDLKTNTAGTNDWAKAKKGYFGQIELFF